MRLTNFQTRSKKIIYSYKRAGTNKVGKELKKPGRRYRTRIQKWMMSMSKKWTRNRKFFNRMCLHQEQARIHCSWVLKLPPVTISHDPVLRTTDSKMHKYQEANDSMSH